MTRDGGHRGRRSIRLPAFDYSAGGVFFVTTCVDDRRLLFGDVADDAFRPNSAGRMVEEVWGMLPSVMPRVSLDAFQLMPNHVHFIVVMAGADDRDTRVRRHDSLADVVRRFKTFTTRRYIDGVRAGLLPPFDGKLWQRDYYEHVVRDDKSLERIRRYIHSNPARWAFDRENPAAAQPIDP